MTPYHYYSRPNNMAYHNLCSNASPPPGIASLLGLGLKFCIESPRPNQRIGNSIRRFQRTVRLHFHFSNEEKENKEANNSPTQSTEDDTVTYIPSLYIPSTWDPPPKLTAVEMAIGKFDKKLNGMRQALPSFRRHNLSPSQ
jgi:hypothetical protein